MIYDRDQMMTLEECKKVWTNQKYLQEARECEKAWKKSGLLDDLDAKSSRQVTAVLLESQRLGPPACEKRWKRVEMFSYGDFVFKEELQSMNSAWGTSTYQPAHVSSEVCETGTEVKVSACEQVRLASLSTETV